MERKRSFWQCGLFRRFQLIEILDKNLENEDSGILIFDSILMAVRVEDIKQAYEKLEIYEDSKQQYFIVGAVVDSASEGAGVQTD